MSPVRRATERPDGAPKDPGPTERSHRAVLCERTSGARRPTAPMSMSTLASTSKSSASQPASGPRIRNRATSAATKPPQASQFGRTPVLSTVSEVAAMRADMPTKAKRYIHPESANEKKPSWASCPKFSNRAWVAG